jgi:Protein of unknown function (DUF1353)
MLRKGLLSLLFLSASASICYAEGFGKYVGSVQTEWIDSDRKMRLLAPFTYVDPKGVEWTAPSGWVIDGASIPVFAWSIIGGPYNGKYRNASVIHDVACDQKTQPWEQVHETFYWAMLASGVENWRAKVMYAAVYHFGPRWDRVVTVSVPKDQAPAAEQQVLAQAEPGSGVAIIAVRPEPQTRGVTAAEGPQLATVEVKIQPPPRQLSESDFEKLKANIMDKEAKAAPRPMRTRGISGGGGGGGAGGTGGNATIAGGPPEGVSLAEIRSFKPGP